MAKLKLTKTTHWIAIGVICSCLNQMSHAQDEGAKFHAVDDKLVMTGAIMDSTPGRLEAALSANSGVREIIMKYVPGSDGDDGWTETARLVRHHQLTTTVPADGMIASGGTDLFLAGVNRKIEHGACIGIHAWDDDELPQGMTALDLPADHEEHQIYLEYYKSIGIDPAFYWYTLEIADAQSMHWMHRDEFYDFQIDVTRIATDEVTLGRLPACEQR